MIEISSIFAQENTSSCGLHFVQVSMGQIYWDPEDQQEVNCNEEIQSCLEDFLLKIAFGKFLRWPGHKELTMLVNNFLNYIIFASSCPIQSRNNNIVV